jgi:hypothetical protein
MTEAISKGQQRVDSTRSPNRRGMSGLYTMVGGD